VSRWIHGLHAVLEALEASPDQVTRVVAAAGREDARLRRVIDTARRAGVPVLRQPGKAIDRLAGPGAAHQGVVALAAEAAYADPDEVLAAAPRPALFVVLDGVEDPRNLGAVIRAAAAAGAGGLFVPEHRTTGLSAACIKASAGTAMRFPVARIGNVAAFLRRLKEAGIWVVGLDAGGAPLWTGFDLTQPTALVLGAEGRGLRRLAREGCDAVLALPMAAGVESLNLAVAAGVALYEALRQRGGVAGGPGSPGVEAS
jgi:23S rRNA (guanosine2251-2'-O)-methyltransferase